MTKSSEVEYLEPAERDPVLVVPKPRLGVSILAVRVLNQRRNLVCAIVIVGLVLSVVLAFLLPKEYESTTRLMPPDNQNGSAGAVLSALTGKGSGLELLASDMLGVKGTGALMIGILQSRRIQDTLIDKFDLQKVYGIGMREDARKKLIKRTEFSEDRKSGIISINVADRDPRRAAAMAQTYVDQLNQLVSELNTSSAHRERVFLETRLGTVRQDLQTAEKELGSFSSKNATLDIKEEGKALVQASSALEGQLIAAQSELEGLKQIYTGDNVRVRSLEAKIAGLRRGLEGLAGKGREADVLPQASGQSTFPALRTLPVLGVTYADLYRQVAIQEAVFEALTKQYEFAKVQEAKETLSVKVLDPPYIPQQKSFPPRILIVLLGTVVSFIAAMVFVLASRYWHELNPEHPNKLFVRELLGLLGTRWGMHFKDSHS